MIQFNLLPDVKIEYLRTKRQRRVITLVAIATTCVFVGVMLVLATVVLVYQRQYIKSLDAEIKTSKDEIASIPNIDKILTVQNQLIKLPDLHKAKPAVTRLYGYITQVTPSNVFISSLNVDFATDTMTITGTSDTIASINTFVDTLKFATFSTGSTQSSKAFSNVVLTSYGKTDKGASYSLSFKFDKKLFDGSVSTTITVPKSITTRSETEKPGDVFSTTNQTNTPASR